MPPMGTTYQSDVGRLRRAVLKHPRDAFGTAEAIDAQWKSLGFLARPDPLEAAREFDAFAGLLEKLGTDVLLLPPAEDVGLDSIYARDASAVTDAGVILCRMGKAARHGEPRAQGLAFREWGVPVLAAIEAEGRLEGGDVEGYVGGSGGLPDECGGHWTAP